MNSSAQNRNADITTLVGELAISALQAEKLGPWIQLERPTGKIPPTVVDLGGVYFDLEVWIKTAKPHPPTPPMKESVFEALKKGIAEFGIIDGVIYIDEHGNVVDGFHRMKAIYELLKAGVALPPPEIRFVEFQTAANEMAFVLLLNVTRRNIDDGEMEEVLKDILRSGHEGTDNWLSDLCGLSAETVQDIRRMLENTPLEDGGIEFIPARHSEAGKTYLQTQAEPTSQKRRTEAGLGPKAKAAASPNVKKMAGVKQAPDVGQPTDPGTEAVGEEAVSAGGEFSAELTPQNSGEQAAISSPEDEVDPEIAHLVEAWWTHYQFVPVLSRDLVALIKAASADTEPTKGEADILTRKLRPHVGTLIRGHMVLSRVMSSKVRAFFLAPSTSPDAPGIDLNVLLRHAGK